MELILGGVAMVPVEMHVHGLGLIGHNSVIGDSVGCGVIGLDW